MRTTGVVSRITQFGVFLETEFGSALVHMAEQSWTWPFTNDRQMRLGEQKELLLLSQTLANSHTMRASLRQLVPPPSGSLGQLKWAAVKLVDDRGIILCVDENSSIDFSKKEVEAAKIDVSTLFVGSFIPLIIDDISDGSIFLRFEREFEERDDKNDGKSMPPQAGDDKSEQL